jgi:hypothetical protein
MAEDLNFVAKIHRMSEYPWQCLNFRGIGQHVPVMSDWHLSRF